MKLLIEVILFCLIFESDLRKAAAKLLLLLLHNHEANQQTICEILNFSPSPGFVVINSSLPLKFKEELTNDPTLLKLTQNNEDL